MLPERHVQMVSSPYVWERDDLIAVTSLYRGVDGSNTCCCRCCRITPVGHRLQYTWMRPACLFWLYHETPILDSLYLSTICNRHKTHCVRQGVDIAEDQYVLLPTGGRPVLRGRFAFALLHFPIKTDGHRLEYQPRPARTTTHSG